jgi:hypothetical protein
MLETEVRPIVLVFAELRSHAHHIRELERRGKAPVGRFIHVRE